MVPPTLGLADEAPTVADAIGSNLTPGDWITAIVVVMGVVVASSLVRRGLVRVLRRGTTRAEFAEVLVGRIVQWGLVLLGVTYAMSVLGVRISPLLGALGIGGVAAALALQPMLQNLVAGVVLHAQRPIRRGDEVVSGDVRGTVVDITTRSVMVRTYDDRVVYIPNTVVLEREIENVVRTGARRTTLEVGVAYGTDLDRARRVLDSAVRSVPAVRADPPPRILATAFADSAVTFDLDFWHDPEEATMRATRAEVVHAVHRALAEAGITIPFPQRTLWWGQPAQAAPPPSPDPDPRPAPGPGTDAD